MGALAHSQPPAMLGSYPNPRVAEAGRASFAPLLMGILALALSVALLIVTLAIGVPTSLWPGVVVVIVAANGIGVPLAGYLLTPMLTIAALGWDRIAQRRGLRDRNFVLRPAYSRALSWIAAASFVPAVWHILNLAVIIAEPISEAWGLA